MVGYLLSFFYFQDTNLDDLAAASGRPDLKFFADSGAYSAMTTGAPVDIDEYAAWVKTWQHRLSVHANLDVHYDWERGRENQRHLEGLGLNPVPVYHIGEPLGLFEEMAAESDLVAIGGIVGKRSAALWSALDNLHGIAADHGAGIHGFGIGDWRLIQKFPWDSVDSSSMGASFRYGQAHLFNLYESRWIRFRAEDAGEWHRWGWLLREYGFDPKEFSEADRKQRMIPLLRLAGLNQALASSKVPGMTLYLVDLGFPHQYEGRERIGHYEDGVKMAEAVLG